MNLTKIALSVVLILNALALNAKWVNTDEIKEDLKKGWQEVKKSPETIKRKMGSRPKHFTIAPEKEAVLKIEDTETQVKITIDGVAEDILGMSHEGEKLTITIAKK